MLRHALRYFQDANEKLQRQLAEKTELLEFTLEVVQEMEDKLEGLKDTLSDIARKRY